MDLLVALHIPLCLLAECLLVLRIPLCLLADTPLNNLGAACLPMEVRLMDLLNTEARRITIHLIMDLLMEARLEVVLPRLLE